MGLELSIYYNIELDSEDFMNFFDAGATDIRAKLITLVEISIDKESDREKIYEVEQVLLDKYPNEIFDFRVSCRRDSNN